MNRVRQRRERGSPALYINSALGASFVLPRIVGWQVELAGTARNSDTAADAHQPVILSQRLPCFAGQVVQGHKTLVQLADDFVQNILRDCRITDRKSTRL